VVADIIVAAIILFPAAAIGIHTVPREPFARASLTWALMSIEREEWVDVLLFFGKFSPQTHSGVV
jgi:hypothetical protein